MQHVEINAEKLLHELRVHQIELEIQLEELHRASSEADALRDRYADIYDFSPVSYFTLDAKGNIIDINLAGAILLGIKRSDRTRDRFSAAIKPEHQAEFDRFLKDVLRAKNNKFCELTLLPTRQHDETTVRIEAISDENGDECRMVVIDISAERQAKKLLAEREHHLQTLLDNLPFMVWLKDDQSRFLAVNKAVSAEYG